jgi:predicted GNAT family acetyltransferase
MAIVVDGNPVSVCFSARSSPVACEAGVETAAQFRGRGYAGVVTAAWARAIRASGRTPFYSTSWTNGASLANARKLGLIATGSSWSVVARLG